MTVALPTACGAVDPALEPGTLVVFDDSPSNRLLGGELCSCHDAAAAPLLAGAAAAPAGFVYRIER